MNHKHSNSGKSHGHQSQMSMRGEHSQMNSQYGKNFGTNKDSEYGYGGEMGDYEMNERTSPSRFSLDLSRSVDSQRGHFGKGPKGYKRSDDRIKEEVCETLARHPKIDAREIEVEVSDSMVTLSGTVESKDIRRAAEMAIENLSGVGDVKNDIRVKKTDSHSTSSDSTFVAPSSTKHAKMPTSSFKESSQIS